MMDPEVLGNTLLSHLNRADGSVTYSQGGYTVVGAVNGPVEAQRKDELAEEAAVDVILRPVSGTGGRLPRDGESRERLN